MSSVNKVAILGRLGADPELNRSQNGVACNLSVATTRVWTDKNGDRQQSTEWHRIVLFKRQAEIAGQYLKKGDLAYFDGELRTRKWSDRDGIERYTTEIVCNNLQLIGGSND